MEGIQISLSKVGARRDIALFRVKGYLDTQTCSEMSREMTAVMKQGVFHIIVDMGQVNYVSSAGWGVFVGEIKGIRENGGDLKLVQMMPEVFDVFEMLEFNRILECYDSIEEAIDDFDISIGLDITKSFRQALSVTESSFRDVTLASPPVSRPSSWREGEGSRLKSRTVFTKPKISEHALPFAEKIKAIVISNPVWGAWKIRQELNTERFGFTKASWWRVYRTLKKLNLATKEQRYRFYRSR
ncbi:MAG: STAS domain-containing protein [candidate division KSB1 bacterium]|nr:STAS domain-containing protein [candidate division KSB1 bacterium]MDZ7303570.1 STAS domain-containing protein [candidate division KSB1 bacterium]MDZ7312813.1 STAS domain-containing protein [candidate division KSB1 bacterium]